MTDLDKLTILKFLNEQRLELQVDILDKDPEFVIKWKRDKLSTVDWLINKVKEMK